MPIRVVRVIQQTIICIYLSRLSKEERRHVATRAPPGRRRRLVHNGKGYNVSFRTLTSSFSIAPLIMKPKAYRPRISER